MKTKLALTASAAFLIFFLFASCNLPVLKFRDMQIFTYDELGGKARQYNPMITVSKDNTVYLGAYGWDTTTSDLLYYKIPDETGAAWESKTLFTGTLGQITTWHMISDRENHPYIFYKEAASWRNLAPDGGTVYPQAPGTGTFMRVAFKTDNLPVIFFTGGGMPQFDKYQAGWSGYLSLMNQSPFTPETFDGGIDDNNKIYGIIMNGSQELALNFRGINDAMTADVTFDSFLSSAPLSSAYDDANLYAVYSSFRNSRTGVNLIRISKSDFKDFQIERIDESSDGSPVYQVSNLVRDQQGYLCFSYYEVNPSAGDKWILKAVVCSPDGETVIRTLDSGNAFLGVYSGKRPATGADSKGNLFIAYQSIKDGKSYGSLMLARTRP